MLSTSGREFPVATFGDLIRCPPEMRAVTIVTQNPAHGPALDVAIDAVLPGIISALSMAKYSPAHPQAVGSLT
jgi:hypothetical protein